MLKIRPDKRVKYQGHGDSEPGSPPNYFQKLFSKYTTEATDCPAWLSHYFPNLEVRQRLIRLRQEAVYYFIEGAKLKVRTTRGWHHKRRVGDLRILGGRLTSLKKAQASDQIISEIESQIRSLRDTRARAQAQFEMLVDDGQYAWHSVMFEITEYLEQPGRTLPSKFVRGLCYWLSFPEIGVRCTYDTVKAAKRRFYIERRNGYSYRVYQYQFPRTAKDKSGHDKSQDTPWEKRVFRNGTFQCHRCGRRMAGREIGAHLHQDENIPIELINVDETIDELHHSETLESLASWVETE